MFHSLYTRNVNNSEDANIMLLVDLLSTSTDRTECLILKKNLKIAILLRQDSVKFFLEEYNHTEAESYQLKQDYLKLESLKSHIK